MNLSLGFPGSPRNCPSLPSSRWKRWSPTSAPRTRSPIRRSARSTTSRPPKASLRRHSGGGGRAAARRLEKRGIARLYSHQADAFDQIQAGKQRRHRHAHRQRQDALLQPAGAQSAAARRRARAPCICSPPRRWPKISSTNSSARWRRWAARSAPSPTTATRRRMRARAIRQRANVVLTNPDMLHSGILPHHTKWARYFENLRYIVIDELHYYRGVYGSHLANLLRRLQRICEFYSSKPQFICCSATIANPRELAEALTGEPFELVERNGAPRGEKYFIFYNPPVVNRQLGIRRSYINETRRMALEVHRAQSADAGLRQQPPGHGSSGHLSEGRLRPRPDSQRDGARLSRRLSAARAPRDRAAACATARSAPWWRPMRSNWASTSARSMRW